MKLVQKVWIFRFQIPKARIHGRFENWKAAQKPMFEVVRGYLIKGNSDESLNVSLWEDGLDNEPIVGNIRIGLNCASPLSDEDLVEIQKLPSPNVFKFDKLLNDQTEMDENLNITIPKTNLAVIYKLTDGLFNKDLLIRRRIFTPVST